MPAISPSNEYTRNSELAKYLTNEKNKNKIKGNFMNGSFNKFSAQIQN